MKYFLRSFIGIFLLVGVVSTQAQTWNLRYGFGNGSAGSEWTINGAGAPIAVIGGVHSNALYWVGSPNSGAVPVINQVFLKNDLVAGTLKYYVTDGTYETSAAGAAGTNLISLVSTNGLSAYDLLLIRNNASDTYQLVVNSNSVSNPLVTYNAITNGYSAGDTVYRLVALQSFTPMSMHAVTNQVILPFSDTIPFAINKTFIPFPGQRRGPTAVIMTYSNAATLQVNGEYFVQPRR